MRTIECHRVPDDAPKRRLSDFARDVFAPRISRKGVKKAIKRGEIIVDRRPARTGDWTLPGQWVEWVAADRASLKPYRMKLDVPFEDAHVAVVDKPGGLRVGGNQFKTLENVLLHNLTSTDQDDALRRFQPAHRLDAATRGLVAVAKTSRAIVELSRQFERREVRKRYRAVIIGELPEAGVFNQPLDGREAITRYRRVRQTPSPKSGWLSLVDLFPVTGRTHQLRRHLANAGRPILGDREYGVEGLILKGKGLFLCAVELSFRHPVDGRTVTTSIGEPAKFAAFARRESERAEPRIREKSAAPWSLDDKTRAW